VVVRAEHEVGLPVAVDVGECARRVANGEVRISKLGREAAADREVPRAVVEQKPRRDVLAAVAVADVDVRMTVAVDVGGTGGVAVVRRLREVRRRVDELAARCGQESTMNRSGRPSPLKSATTICRGFSGIGTSFVKSARV
jgi:hypothetical protein